MCDFCKNFDFGSASTDVDKYGARVILAGGCHRFSSYRQFNFCPVCGCKRPDTLTENEKEH